MTRPVRDMAATIEDAEFMIKTGEFRRTKELRERSKRMKNGWDRLQGKIDREICEAIYRLPESEVADD